MFFSSIFVCNAHFKSELHTIGNFNPFTKIRGLSVFLQFLALAHITRVNYVKIIKDRCENLHTKFLAKNLHLNHLSFDLFSARSFPYGDLRFGYFSKTRYDFIVLCSLIAQMSGPMLSRVT